MSFEERIDELRIDKNCALNSSSSAIKMFKESSNIKEDQYRLYNLEAVCSVPKELTYIILDKMKPESLLFKWEEKDNRKEKIYKDCVNEYYNNEIKNTIQQQSIIKTQIEETIKEIDMLTITLNDITLQRYQKFLDFRMKHYNSKIEKLLLDLGLDSLLKEHNITYQSINKNNKTGDGTVEDYIAYIDEL